MTKFIALVSGKGGVGKTTATVNIGQALVNLGQKVTLLDANIITPNLGINLGVMNPKATLNQFLRKEKSLKEIIYTHESGISFIPASPSFIEFQKTDPGKLKKIFDHLNNTADYVLIDSPSGLSYEVEQVLKNCDQSLVIVTPNLSSVMDALKTIELAKAHNNMITGIVLNMSNRGKHELKPEEVEKILDAPIIANIRFDKKVRKAAHHQIPLNYLYKRSKAARGFLKVAHFISGDPNPK